MKKCMKIKLLLIVLFMTTVSINAQERKVDKNSEKKSSHKVFTKVELLSKYEIKLDSLKKANVNPEMQAKLQLKIKDLKTTKP